MNDYSFECYESDVQGELVLIQRAARGDHEAFRDLVVAYEGKLLAYLIQMLGDVDNARDVLQETFIAIFHALPRWQAPTDQVQMENVDHQHPLAPWLYRVATNHALSLIRKQTVRKRTHGQVGRATDNRQTEPDITVSAVMQQMPFEDRYAARELLREALSHLSEEDAACLVLHYVSGERYGEIAVRLGLSSEAVRKRVTRGLIALRKAYFVLDTEVRS